MTKDQARFGELEADVLATVRRCLEPYGPGAADVSTIWSDPAGMWFIEVTPRRSDAASVSIGVDGDELLLTFARTRVELWSGTPTPIEQLGQFLGSIFAGDFEEAGSGDGFAKGRFPSGKLFRCGSMHLPLPWAWRRKTRYSSY